MHVGITSRGTNGVLRQRRGLKVVHGLVLGKLSALGQGLAQARVYLGLIFRAMARPRCSDGHRLRHGRLVLIDEVQLAVDVPGDAGTQQPLRGV